MSDQIAMQFTHTAPIQDPTPPPTVPKNMHAQICIYTFMYTKENGIVPATEKHFCIGFTGSRSM